MESSNRIYRLDVAKIRRLMLQQGLTQEQFAQQSGLARKTVQRITSGKGSLMATIEQVAKFFDIQDITEILAPEEVASNGERRLNGRGRIIGDWESLKPRGPWETASNSLQYRLHQMAHLHLSNTFGRGKCYDLGQLSVQDREQLREHLERHPQVCRRLSSNPHVAVNSTARPDEADGNWWVVDEWIDGRSLADHLQAGTIDRKDAPTILRGIADGLAALQQHGIVRRELSPTFVLLRSDVLVPVLTDFELAKLLDTDKTVSDKHHWKPDPYRAPEVTGGVDVDARADVYSWGRIAIHLVCGTLPAPGEESDTLSSAKLPRGIADLLLACVQLPRSERPDDMATVLRGIKGWK